AAFVGAGSCAGHRGLDAAEVAMKRKWWERLIRRATRTIRSKPHPTGWHILRLERLEERLAPAQAAGTDPPRGQPGGPAIMSQLDLRPLGFEENVGQTASQVCYLAHGDGYTLFLTSDEAVLRLQGPTGSGAAGSAALSMRLVGGNAAPRIEGLDE